VTWFFTRVVLHGDAPDYDALDAEMAKAAFTRDITDNDGRRYRLPVGHYFSAYGDPRTTAGHVRVQAHEIGKGLAGECWVLVAKPIDWSGWLEPLAAAAADGSPPAAALDTAAAPAKKPARRRTRSEPS
jgi:hypothetical protein